MDFADKRGFDAVGLRRKAELDDIEEFLRRVGPHRFPRQGARPRFEDGTLFLRGRLRSLRQRLTRRIETAADLVPIDPCLSLLVK
jgi:hypothetical protein